MTSVGVMASAVTAACTAVAQEPFDYFGAWTLGGGTPTIVTGRTGTAAQFSGSTSRASYLLAGPAQSDTLTVGFAFRKTDANATLRSVLELRDATDSTIYNTLKLETNGALGIYRAGTTQFAVSAASIIANNTWYYLEVQIRLHNTLGTVTVKRDGVDVITFSGDTSPASDDTAVYGALRLVNGVASTTHQFDDLYLSTGAGCTFQGDHAITASWPAGTLPVRGLLAGWWDADDATTFSFSSGTVVSQWNDKSGYARHVVQGTVANQPSRSGSQNGRATVVFDGTTDRLTVTSWAMTKPVTMFAVARNTAASGQRDLFTCHTDGRIYRPSGGNVDIYQGATLSTGVAWGTTSFHLVTGVFNGASSKVARNGGSNTTGTAGTTAFAASGTSAIGSYTTATEFWQGDAAELLVYEREVSGSERTDIETYLKTKWGIP